MDLQERMYKAVAPSMRDFVLKMCMDGQIVVNEDLRELNQELHRQGNNLNQLVRLALDRSEESGSINSLYYDADILVIDDLGSEPMLRGVTVSALYHVINERRNANRAIVITTNCDADQLYEKYDDRIGARLTDPGRVTKITFVGTDVRRFMAQK